MAADFSEIRGQEAAKRAALVALAGGHSIVFFGPPGCGKTMLIDAMRAAGFSTRATEWTVRPRDRKREDWPDVCEMQAKHEIHCEVADVPFRELFRKRLGTSSEDIRAQISQATAYTDTALSDSCLILMKQACTELGLTARGAMACIRVARTIANLERSEAIKEDHLAEAIQYRPLDRCL